MRLSSTILIGSLMLAVACGGQAQQTPVENATPTEEPVTQEPVVQEDTAAQEAAEAAAAQAAAEEEARKQAEAEEARKKEEQARRIAETRARFEASAQTELARWTPALKKKAAALAARNHRNVKAGFKAIQASPHRMPGNADRDKYRHPAETMMFFGLQPNMTVVEVGAGGGWYTELLAPLLAKKGKLIAATYDPNGPADSMLSVYGMRFQSFLAKSPELFGKVETVYPDPAGDMTLGPEGSADLAIAFRELHNWYRRDVLEAYLQAVHAVLKPGGTFGVVQHRAPEGADPAESANKGYLPEAWVIEQIEAAGFELVEKSEINANPNDTKDYEQGVWTLPPAMALGDQDRAKYEAIGESDRMTLKFKKL